ncbi:MAG: transcriptional repressor [Pseudomonadota bacterium]|nr:transcriptional repressor [Pseudomonadota bacterium]
MGSTEKLEQVIADAQRQCQSRGSRLTTKRKQVLSALVQSQKALSAYELIDVYKAQFDDSMPPMSMYRILDFLQSEHLVHKLNLANKFVACAHISCDHAHGVPQFLICGDCNNVQEVHIKPELIDELRDNVKAANFYLISPQLEMNCLCESCFEQAQ